MPSWCARPLGEERRQRLDPAGGDRQARRHRVAAALAQDAGLARGDHGGAEVEARDRAPRALADAVGEADHHRRAVVALDQARRGKAGDAGRPALACGQQQRRIALQRRRERAFGRGQHLVLGGAPLPVQKVEPRGDLGHLLQVLARQQQRAEPGVADAAAGVQAGPEREAEIIAVLQRRDPGDGGEPRDAEVAAARLRPEGPAPRRRD